MAKKYELIARGIEDMPIASNNNTTSTIDVAGEGRTKITKGNKTVEISPVTINPDSEFAKWIDTAIEREYELSQLERKFLFVKMYKKVGATKEDAKPVAWEQTAAVDPSNFAPGNEDLYAESTLNLIGKRTYGTIDFNATGEKFIPETKVPTPDEIFYEEGDAPRSSFAMYAISETA